MNRINKIKTMAGILIGSLLVWSGTGLADDIDLYAGLSPSAGDPPTVLLIWDNAANTAASASPICTSYSDGSGAPSLGTDTAAGMEQCAMVNALLALANDPALLGKIKVGLMVFNKNNIGSNNGNSQCGYLKYAPQLMDSTHVTELVNEIKGFISSGSNSIKANGIAAGTTMAEAWAMLNGQSNSCSGVDYSALPSLATQCRDAVIVYIGNAFTNSNPNDGGAADTLLKSQLTSAFNYAAGSNEYNVFATPMAVTGLNTSGNANNSYWADEWARFMKRVNVLDSAQSDKNITTYAISVTDMSNQAQAQSVINYYANMAKLGGGKSFLVDFKSSSALVEALLSIFNEVQDVNSVFASATLPVSANTQGTYLNQVFIAMFRPDGSAAPRWYGNLKQYQLGLDSGNNIVLTDATEDPDAGAVTSKTNPNTGAIASDAVSFWTTNTPGVTGWPANGFWVNSPSGDALQYESADGDLVAKGGAAQMARVQNLTATYADTSNDNVRSLLTCNSVGACGSGLTSFDTGNSTLISNAGSLFGVSSANSYSATITAAGIPFVSTVAGSCTTGNSGATKSCPSPIVVGYDGAPTLSVGDKVFNTLSGAGEAACSLATSGCAVVTVPSSTSFTYNVSGTGNTLYTVPAGTQFYKAGTLITASTGSAHGMVAGDSVTLTNCTGQADSSTVNGLAALPSSSATYTATIESATSTSFTFNWDTAAFTSANTVSCTIKPTLTASNLINWVRGWDVAGNEADTGPCALTNGVPDSAGCGVTIRPSLHGDVLHSRPAVVNYGGSIGVVVFYGANDGVFHAVNGNQTASIGGVRAGGELWGFIAPEFFSGFKRLFRNSPLLAISGVADADAEPKDYYFDGSTAVLQDFRTGTTTAGKTYLFLSARRGGRLIYALDVTDPTSPTFLWSKSHSDIPELAQTWSQPKVAVLRGRANPVLIFGAGYDPAEDSEPAPVADSMGRGIIILDAVTGETIWGAVPNCSGMTLASDGACVESSDLTRSIAADVTLMDRNSDGNIDRIYAADVGGNIWRVDLEPDGYVDLPEPGGWKLTKLAALGGTGNDARKFLFAPDVIPTSAFDAVMAVSGDREHPLYTSDTTAGLAYNVSNRIYMIMDRDTGAVKPDGYTALTDADLVDNTNPTCLDASSSPVSCTFDSATGGYVDSGGNPVSQIRYTGDPTSIKGFYITLDGAGEKGVNAPVSVAGKTYFGTNQPDVPSAGSCTANLGIAKAYTVDFATASVTTQVIAGGGLPPSPVYGLVNIGGQNIPFIIGGAGPSPFDPSVPEIDLSDSRKRSYWYQK